MEKFYTFTNYIAHIREDGTVQTCNEHSMGTAKLAAKALETVGLKTTGYLAGLLHDVGKYTDEFCEYINKSSKGEPVSKGSVIHSFAGVQLILEKYHHKYSDSKAFTWEEVTAEIIATAIGSHHGLFDEFDSSGESGFDHRILKRYEYNKEAIKNFYKECCSEGEIEDLFTTAVDEIQTIAGKLINLAEGKTSEAQFYIGMLQRLINSAVIDGDRIDTALFMTNNAIDFPMLKNECAEWDKVLTNTETMISSFDVKNELDQARSELSECCKSFAVNKPDIYKLDIKTGGGKTLSSFRYALNHAGIYNKKRIILTAPLLSIIDQNAEIIKKAAGDDNIVLEHHSDIVNESKDSRQYAKRDALIDTWGSPIIVTTFVQLLNVLFKGKTSCVRRFHSLCDSIIIIDEIQSLPDKMTSIFNLSMNFLAAVCNTTIVLCSATQPALENAEKHKLLVSKKQFIPEDVKKRTNPYFKRNTANYGGVMDFDGIATTALQYANKYNSVLIVCNTKKEAKQLASILKDQICCFHLSTSMCKAHRKKVFKAIQEKLDSGERVICVSTQLIEAGVDKSFGSAIRLTAGLGNVAQTAGRCNRNAENDASAPVTVISLEGENLSYLKEIQRGQDVTNELIYEFTQNPDRFDNDLLSSKSISFYYSQYMKKCSRIIGLHDYATKTGGSIYELLSVNRQFAQEDASQSLRQAFKTAGSLFNVFDDEQETIIVPYEEGESIICQLLSEECSKDPAKTKRLLSKAKDYTVTVHSEYLQRLNKAGAVYTDNDQMFIFLRPEFYDSNTGITLDNKEAKHGIF